MITIILHLISLDLSMLNQSKLEMIVLVSWVHSKLMDWTNWIHWKSESIHLLDTKMIFGLIKTNQNHSTYWIVKNWNQLILGNWVSMNLEVNLNDIGKLSFYEFGGEFELKNLPQLQSINIGTIGDDGSYYSSSFWYSSFIIRGILIHYYFHFYRYAQSTNYHIRW